MVWLRRCTHYLFIIVVAVNSTLLTINAGDYIFYTDWAWTPCASAVGRTDSTQLKPKVPSTSTAASPNTKIFFSTIVIPNIQKDSTRRYMFYLDNVDRHLVVCLSLMINNKNGKKMLKLFHFKAFKINYFQNFPKIL